MLKTISCKVLIFLLFIITSLTGCVSKHTSMHTAPGNITMNYITTFQFENPNQIDLEYFTKMSNQRDGIPASKRKKITDPKTISTLITTAHALPDEGDMMIKMGDVPILNIILFYPDQKLYFTFYQERIKTPSTSFYSNTPSEEKTLHDFLFELLNK